MTNVNPPGAGVSGPALYIGGTLVANATSGYVLYSDASGTLQNESVAGLAVPITIGTTAIVSGTDTRVLYDNAGKVGEYTISGTGTVVAMATGPTLSNPVVGTQSTTDNSTLAASTAYVTTAISNAVAGVNPAVAVLVATTAAGDTSALTYANGVAGVGATLTGAVNTAISIDGVTFTTVGQRLLVKNDTQSPSGAFNGVYSLTQVQTVSLPPIFTRALDYNTPASINSTGAIPVVSGTANASTSWLLTSTVTTIGTNALTYVSFTLAPSTIVTLTGSQALTNKTYNGNTFTAGTGTLTLAASSTLATSGAFSITLTSTAGTNVTLPTTGTLATLAGSEALTNKTVNGLTITSSTGTLTIVNSGSLITAGAFAITLTATNTTGITLPTSGTLATLAGTETLTAKTLTNPIITQDTWANVPSGVTAGKLFDCSNFGTKGTLLRYDGTRWKPVNGQTILATLDTTSSNINNSEAVVFQYLLPTNAWQLKDVIRMWAGMTKSGGTDTGTWRIRIGTAGTTSDTQVAAGASFGATSRQYAEGVDLRLETATSVQQVPLSAGSFGYTGVTTTAAVTAAVTITSAAANPLYVSLTLVSSSTNDTVNAVYGAFELRASAN